MMQGGTATLPPWLSPWSSGLLYGQRVYKGTLRERYRPRDRHRPRLTIYTYNHDDSQILRIGGWGADSEPGSGSNTHTARPRPLSWERYGLDREPWRLAAVPAHPQPSDLYREIHMAAADAPGPVSAPPAAPAPASEDVGWGAARGWAAGTALLALLVVLARAAENCIDRKFFKSRRRSEEWPTPNVFATSQQQSITDVRLPPGLEIDSLPPTITVDLPPPYSECTSTAAPKSDYPEEPPPPYSDCYVEFSNKNGIPSVLIFSRRRNSILNRHEIVGSREEATTSDGQTDDTRAVTLEDIRVDERRNDARDEEIRIEELINDARDEEIRNEERRNEVISDERAEVSINTEHDDETAQTSQEYAPNKPILTVTDINEGDIPDVNTVVVNVNVIDNDNVKVV